MLQASITRSSKWRKISWFLIVMMIFCGAIGLSLITKDANQASDYIGLLDSLIAICTGLFIPLIHWSLNQEMKSHRKTTKKNQENEECEINHVIFTQIDEFQDMLEQISKTTIDGDKATSLRGKFENLSERMKEFKNRYHAIQSAKHWIGDKENLKSISRKSIDNIFNQREGISIRNLLINIGLNAKRRNPFYKQVYDCLTWIRQSFYAGTYLPTTLLGTRIKNPELVLEALKWIMLEIVHKGELDSLAQAEINIYFRKLISIIERKIQEDR